MPFHGWTIWRAIDFGDAEHGWMVGDGGTVIRTADGGTTWTEQTVPTGEPLLGISAHGPDIASAVGPGGVIVRTDDGGANWVVDDSGTATVLNDVAATSEFGGWAVGDAGMALVRK